MPRDDSLWLADDNGRAVFEIDPTSGTLKRKIGRAAFEAAPKLGFENSEILTPNFSSESHL